jgi:hypothetical protein
MSGSLAAHRAIEVHLPSRNRHGSPIDIEPWVEQALDLMCAAFGGAYEEVVVGHWTPPGAPRVTERTSRLVSYATDAQARTALPRLLSLAADFMDATDQAVVLVAVDGQPQTVVRAARGTAARAG